MTRSDRQPERTTKATAVPPRPAIAFIDSLTSFGHRLA